MGLGEVEAFISLSPPHHHPHGGDEPPLHLALFYEGEEEYVDGIMRFLAPALQAGDPVAAAVPPHRAPLLRSRLEDSADAVKLLDMSELGSNPARIIPEVEGILAACDGGRLHYVEEPVWPGRSPEELQEATKHEALINVAWRAVPITVLCPYDAAALSPDVLEDAKRTHPYVVREDDIMISDAYRGPTIPQRGEDPLPVPPPEAQSMAFTTDELAATRALVAEVATGAGLSRGQTQDLVLVVSELTSNAIRHGHGAGTLHVWACSDRVTCQVQDRGRICDPLAGRRRPDPSAVGGLGLWMVNQLCDLVEARTGADGTTFRAHIAMTRRPPEMGAGGSE